MNMRFLRIGILAALLAPAVAAAQNSVYGLAGIGFPGLPMGVRAHALGGGVAALDPVSALNPATVAGLTNLTVTASAGTTLRSYTAGDSSASGLRETRFPFGLFGGRITGTPLSFALTYATYAERSYDVTTSGTQVLRGDTLAITDRLASAGAVTDMRGALAFRPTAGVLVGAAFHLLGGSSRLNVRRTFSDSAYLPYAEQRDLSFSGTGFSAGIVLRPTPAIELAGSGRVDGTLKSRLGTDDAGTVHLPATWSVGLRILPVRGLGWSTTAARRTWSRAQPDLAAPARAFDTWEIASGLELADPAGRGFPIRVGVRYRQLPFSNVATQPTELVLAGGTGVLMAGGRAAMELAVERLKRSGGGADERGWQFSAGIVLIP